MSANLLVLLAAVPSFLITVAAVPWVRRRAPRWGLVARPRTDRFHKEPTPLGGGLAIWLGVVATFAAIQLLLWLIAAGAVRIEVFPQLLATHFAGLQQQSPKLWTLLAAATVMMILGLADDRGGIDWRLRLAIQTLVAAMIVWQGWRLTAFIDAPLFTGTLSVLWIVGIVNAFNMLDNMDGLSAGVAWIASAILIAVILTAPDPQSTGPQLFVAGFLLVLAGATRGFLATQSAACHDFHGRRWQLLRRLLHCHGHAHGHVCRRRHAAARRLRAALRFGGANLRHAYRRRDSAQSRSQPFRGR